MALSSGQITVGLTPTQIDGMSTNPTVLHISNNDNTQAVYIGAGNVQVLGGLRLEKLERITITLHPGESLYAISEKEGHVISFLRQTLY
jgi:hypothetical protein